MKKIIAVLSALVLVFCSFGQVYASDISGSKYAADIETLVNLGIMTGYEDGTYRPDSPITRQEFVTLTVRLFDLESVGASALLPFDDADTWANGYIKDAYALGLVNGVSEDKFAPEANVTINQAVKIVVSALGYGEYALKNGGYPFGYNSFAAKKDITEDVAMGEKEATRGEIASILVNALEVNMCEDIYSTNGKTEFREGTETVLSRRGLRIIEGILLGAEGISVSDYEPSEGEVNISGTVYRTELEGTGKFIGRKVVAYADKDEDTIYHINLSKSNKDNLVIYASEIDLNTTTKAIIYTRQKKTRTEKLSDAAVFVLNGKVINQSEASGVLSGIRDGRLELIDTDRNSYYDIVLIYRYDTYIVNSIVDKTVYDLFGKNIDTEEYESDNDKYLCFYKGDSTASLSDIEKGNVLSAAISSDGMYATVYVSDDYIDGTITGTYDEDGYTYYSIESDNDEVTVRASAWYSEMKNSGDARILSAELGSEVRAYLNCSGEIAFIESGDFGNDYRYGVLVGMEKKNTISSKGKVKILTLDNVFEIMEISGSVKTGYNDNGKYRTEKLTADDLTKVIDGLPGSKVQVIRYVSEDGELKKLQFPDDEASTEHLYKCGSQFSGYYREGVIDQKYIVNKDTVCFRIPGDGSETNKLSAGRACDMLSNGSRNNIIVYDVKNGIAGAIVKVDTILDGTLLTAIDKANSDVMLVEKTYHSSGNDGSDYLILEGWVNGKKKAVLCSDTLSANPQTQSDLRAGVLVQYETNHLMLQFAEYSEDDEVIELYKVLNNPNTDTDFYKTWNYTDIYSSNAEVCITYGRVNYVYDNHYVIDTVENNEQTQTGIELNAGTAVYKYYRSEKKVEKATADDISTGMNVVIRQRYGSVREVIIVKD